MKSDTIYFEQPIINPKQSFDLVDYEQLVQFADGPSSLEAHQLERGNFQGRLFHNKFEHFNLTLFQVNRATKYTGVSPKKHWSFIILARTGMRQTCWEYPEVTENCIAVMPPYTMFDSITRTPYEQYSLHVTEERLSQACQLLELPEPKQLFGRVHRIILCCPKHRLHFCQLMIALQNQLLNSSQAVSPSYAYRELEWEILLNIILAIAECLNFSAPTLSRKRFLAIKKAETYMMENLYESIQSKDVCQAVGISQRTLEYVFRECYGITPKAYFKKLRLNAVHKELKQTDNTYQEVSAIAQRFGFTHMGQFAQDYQKQFGVLPSQVLRSQHQTINGVSK